MRTTLVLAGKVAACTLGGVAVVAAGAVVMAREIQRQYAKMGIRDIEHYLTEGAKNDDRS